MEYFTNSLLSQMRRETNGEFGDKLDKAKLDEMVEKEEDWLMNAEEEDIQVITDRFNTFEESLKTTFSEYYAAKEKKHLEIEKQLEEESKKRVDVMIDILSCN